MEESVEALRRLAEECVNSKGKADIQETTTNGLLLLLQLKEESRKLAFKAEDQREETSKFKARLEQAHLQLQNLLYEKEYYEKEIHECQNFRFKHSDSAIGLVPVDKFTQSAGAEVLERIGDDPHKLMLERLRDELAQRKAMVAELEELRKKKAATRLEVDKRKRTLDDLQQQLQGLEDTAKPLQSILAPHLSLRGFARSADLLPLPLYIVYSQLAAAREALGLPIRVAILGSSVEAESFAKAQTLDPADAAGDAAGGGPTTAGGAAAATAGTTSSAPAAAAAVSEPASKLPRLSPAPLLASSLPAAPASTDDLYKVHPLSVLLEVQRENNGRLQTIISVKFQFLVNLKLVTAHSDVRDDNLLLAALFPGDDGSATAFESLAQLQGGTFKFDTSRPAKPYRWCQHLAGLDFAPALPLATQLQAGQAGQGQAEAGVLEGLDTYRRQQRVVHVIDRLRAVKTGDEALKKILPALDKTPNPPNLTRYPKLPLTVVATVEEIKTQPAGAAAGSAAAKGKEGGARAAVPSFRPAPSKAPSSGPAPSSGQQPAPSAALPAHLRAEAAAAAEDGEVGRSRRGTPARDGTATPAPDGAGGEGTAAAITRVGSVAASLVAGPAAGTAAAAAAATGVGDAMEDGEAAEDGEDRASDHGEHGDDGDMEVDGGAAADELIARYLLTDVLAAEGGPGGAGGEGRPAAAKAAPKPVSRLYRIVLRHKLLECEVLARLYLEYPLRPPLLLVKSVREVARDRRVQPRLVEDVNLVSWLEAEANSAALSCVPPDCQHYTLVYQLLHLRLAFDEFAAVYQSENGAAAAAAAAGPAAAAAAAAGPAAAAAAAAGGPGGGEDLMALLASKQRMRGRDRRVTLPVLPEASVGGAGSGAAPAPR